MFKGKHANHRDTEVNIKQITLRHQLYRLRIATILTMVLCGLWDPADPLVAPHHHHRKPSTSYPHFSSKIAESNS